MTEINYRSTKPANVVSAIVFILAMGTFAYIGVQNWLPFLILNVGIAVTLRQLLLKNHIDTIICLIVFGAAFVTSLLGFFAVVFLPSLFILGAIYFIIRQFFNLQQTTNKGHISIKVEEASSKENNTKGSSSP